MLSQSYYPFTIRMNNRAALNKIYIVHIYIKIIINRKINIAL